MGAGAIRRDEELAGALAPNSLKTLSVVFGRLKTNSSIGVLSVGDAEVCMACCPSGHRPGLRMSVKSGHRFMWRPTCHISGFEKKDAGSVNLGQGWCNTTSGKKFINGLAAAFPIPIVVYLHECAGNKLIVKVVQNRLGG